MYATSSPTGTRYRGEIRERYGRDTGEIGERQGRDRAGGHLLSDRRVARRELLEHRHRARGCLLLAALLALRVRPPWLNAADLCTPRSAIAGLVRRTALRAAAFGGGRRLLPCLGSLLLFALLLRRAHFAPALAIRAICVRTVGTIARRGRSGTSLLCASLLCAFRLSATITATTTTALLLLLVLLLLRRNREAIGGIRHLRVYVLLTLVFGHRGVRRLCDGRAQSFARAPCWQGGLSLVKLVSFSRVYYLLILYTFVYCERGVSSFTPWRESRPDSAAGNVFVSSLYSSVVIENNDDIFL
jgi:hypothetical protein